MTYASFGPLPAALPALLLLMCCWPNFLWAPSRGLARAAEVLSKDDAHWLALLQPAARSGLPGWLDAHERLAAEVAAAKEAGGLDYVIYGDSIMEAFRGEMLGTPAGEEYDANKEAWSKAFAGKKAGVFAIAGDQAVHLLWRLGQGEGPQGLNPKIVTVMIGTNDVGHLRYLYGDDNSTAGHIIALAVQQCVRELQRQAPQATLVVFGLLPLQPLTLDGRDRQYDGVIQAANKEIEQFVQKQQSQKLKFKDCGAAFLHEDGSLDATKMPDGIHPAGPGGQALLQCMLEAMGLSAGMM